MGSYYSEAMMNGIFESGKKIMAEIKDSGNRREFETGENDSVTRKVVIEKALQTVTQDREQQYGAPEDSFKAIAGAWSWYLDKEITAKDVAVMMCLFKISRVKTGRFKSDNWLDLIGYAACGAELEGLE
ncbi:MAG: DUF6378 domain-containing protein [Anaerotignaceae bacterium]